MKKTFALSRLPGPGHEYVKDVDLWCEWGTNRSDDHWFYKKKKPTKRHRGRSFYVINGAWYGHYDKKTNTVICHAPHGDIEWQAEIVWEGEVPKAHNPFGLTAGYPTTLWQWRGFENRSRVGNEPLRY